MYGIVKRNELRGLYMMKKVISIIILMALITTNLLNISFASSNNSDFELYGSTIIKYHGSQSTVIIPDTVTTIANDAFANCTFLQSVTIPDSVTTIYVSAFYN